MLKIAGRYLLLIAGMSLAMWGISYSGQPQEERSETAVIRVIPPLWSPAAGFTPKKGWNSVLISENRLDETLEFLRSKGVPAPDMKFAPPVGGMKGMVVVSYYWRKEG